MMMIMMMMMVIIITVVVVVVIIMIIKKKKNVFLERLSMSNMLNCAKQAQVQNIKHMHIRQPKQHVSKQSRSNFQLNSKDGLKKSTYA